MPRPSDERAGASPDRSRVEVEREAVAAELAAPGDDLALDEVKRRAATGVATLGARSVLIFGLGLVGNLVLARLLTPRDFGLVALGTTLILVIQLVSEAGFAAALIRRPETPSRVELQGVLAIQLTVTVVVCGGFAAAALPFGEDGTVPALMLAALPIASLRLPSTVLLERRLAYRVIARVDVVEAVANYVWAIATVAAGWGVWGLASAAPVRALLGTATMLRLGPVGLIRPRWSWPSMRPIVGFGLRFQAIGVVGAVRDQGLNAGIAAVGGLSALGVWSLAYRIMQVPWGIFVTLFRVSYPAMARLIASGEPAAPVIERGVGVVAVALSPVLVGIAAGAPGLTSLIGDRWSDVPDILVLASVGIMVSAPIAVSGTSYLLAAGETSTVLLAAVLQTAAWLAVALSLLVPIGVGAVGLGWLVMSLVEAILIGSRMQRRTGARIVAALGPPLAVSVAAAAIGLAVGATGGDGVVRPAVGLLAAELLLLAGLVTFVRQPLRATMHLGARAIRREPAHA